MLVDGEVASLDSFVEQVQTERPEGAEVERIDVAEYDGTIRPIERFAQRFLLTQRGKFVQVGMAVLGTEKEIKKDTGMMLEKQDQMLGKGSRMNQSANSGRYEKI